MFDDSISSLGKVYKVERFKEVQKLSGPLERLNSSGVLLRSKENQTYSGPHFSLKIPNGKTKHFFIEELTCKELYLSFSLSLRVQCNHQLLEDFCLRLILGFPVTKSQHEFSSHVLWGAQPHRKAIVDFLGQISKYDSSNNSNELYY